MRGAILLLLLFSVIAHGAMSESSGENLSIDGATDHTRYFLQVLTILMMAMNPRYPRNPGVSWSLQFPHQKMHREPIVL